METNYGNIYRKAALVTHLYFCTIIIEIWGFQLKTFLFLTKINFFLNIFIFSYLILNSYLHFDQTNPNNILPKKVKHPNKTIEFIYIYSITEMTMIKVSFCLSLGVNILYWLILYLSNDFMGTTDTPLYVEYFLHGGNTVVILLECFFNKKSVHNNVNLTDKAAILFGFFYVSLKYLVYYTMDLQIYPMISKLSIPAYYSLVILGYIIYLLGCFIYKTLFL